MSDQPVGRVLVVDADYDTLGALARALRGRGHHVVLAADSGGGLSRAVEVAADVVLIDRDVPGLDVRTFLEVLRENPRTSGAHTFVMGTGDPGRLRAIDSRAELLVKPFNAEEITARVDEILRARLAPKKEPELRGELGQVSLFDLLQMLAANRRTGRLEVQSSTASGEVFIRDGLIVDAVAGRVVGDRALYRILRLTEGLFVFSPSVIADHERISGSTDRFLMEGARRSDETARLRVVLPSFDALLVATPGAAPATPLSREILSRLDEPRAIDELLDLVPGDDLEVLAEIGRLFSTGVVRVFDATGRRVRFVEEAETITVRAAATRLRRAGFDGTPRLGIAAAYFADMRRFARALVSIDVFVPAAAPMERAGGGAFGSLGTLRLLGTDLELFAIPLEPSLRPLVGALLACSEVLLVLTDDAPDELLVQLARALELKLVSVPPGWETPKGAAHALKAALAAVSPAVLARA